MSQFDVHRLTSGETLVVDCQSDLLEHLNTRLVAPLILLSDAPAPLARLNPSLVVGDREYVMAAQLAAAVHRRELGDFVISLRDRSFEIVGALNVLIGGV